MEGGGAGGDAIEAVGRLLFEAGEVAEGEVGVGSRAERGAEMRGVKRKWHEEGARAD